MKIRPPTQYRHVATNQKKKQLSDRENDKILNDNKILLKKMLNIDKNPQDLNPRRIVVQDVPSSGSLNRKVR